MSINSIDLRYSDELARRDIPSFIEPPPPLIQNPFMKPRPEKGINLLEKFEENSDNEDETELVQVYLRVKPCQSPSNLYEIRSDKCFITSLDTTTAGHGRRTQQNVSKMYTFTRIFKPECSQKEIFEQVVKDNLKKLVDGHSFTLLTYGASGSGKTHTVIGTVNDPGLVPRSLEYLFKLVDAAQMPVYMPTDSGVQQLALDKQNVELKWVKRIRQLSADCPIRDKYRRMSAQLQTDLTISNVDLANRTKYYVWVSFVEIYNDNIYDLLLPPEKRTKLQIREDSSGNVYVKGVNQAFVRSAEEAYDVMVAGKQNLVVAATGVHKQSSRSHCIFTITMLTENEGEIRSSQVRLCDLAGCERQKAAENSGARMQESRAINSSLHVLERCLHMVRRKQRTASASCVPYRESKLTRLLGAGLSGARGEAVSMVVTLNPAHKHANQTKHVLSLASVAKDIQVNNTMSMSTFSSLERSMQESTSCSDEVMRLRTENERLHFEQLQAMNTIAKLQFHIDEKQQESANTMRELVEETRESMTAFYETRLNAVQRQKKDMEEEYESLLAEKEDLIAELRRELREKEAYIQAHIRSRGDTVTETGDTKDVFPAARPKQNYIETKDMPSDSSDSDDDLEESLNPVHRRTIDAIMSEASVISKCFQRNYEEKENPPETEVPSQKQHIIDLDLDESNNEDSEHELDTENECDNANIQTKVTEENFADNEDSINDDANHSKDDGDKSKDSLYATGDEDSDIEQSKQDSEDLTSNLTHTTFEKVDNSQQGDESVNDYENDRSGCEKSFNVSIRVKKPQTINTLNVRGTHFVSDLKEDERKNPKNVISSSIRGTYFVNDSEGSKKNENCEDVHELKAVNNLRGSYVIAKRDVSFYKEANITDQSEKEKESDQIIETSEMKDKCPVKEQIIPETKQNVKEFVKPKEKVVNKVLRSLKSRKSSNSSLKQFEQIESDINAEKSPEKGNTNSTFVSNPHLPTLKEKKTYFDDSMQVEVSDATAEILDTDGKKHESNIKSNYFEDSIDVVKPSLVCSGKLCLLSSAAKVQEKLLFNNVTASPTKQTKFDEDKTNKDTNFIRTPRVTEAKLYFDESDKVRTTDVLLSKSPSLVRDDDCQDYVPSVAVKKILGQNFAVPEVPTTAQIDAPKRHDSVDVFESPRVNLAKDKPTENHKMTEIVSTKEPTNKEESNKPFPNVKERTIEIARQLVEGVVESQTNKGIVIKQEKISLERTSFTQQSKESIINIYNKAKDESKTNDDNESKIKQLSPVDIVIKVEEATLKDTLTSNNTIDEFEKIVKDLTNVRATEFDLLLSETENNPETTKDLNVNIPNEINKMTEVIKENLEISKKETTNDNDQTEISKRRKKFEEIKYNLRNKGTSINLNSLVDKNHESDKSIENDKPKTFTKRSLRLRRRQNRNELEESEVRKLKDIRNLEKEFSDVTLGVPVEKKVVKDIPSPEKISGDEENLPPPMGIQSCPSKSVTRSRRKLFTPRAEPLEESPGQGGDSTDRVCVPRPSYHRTRTRRKL